MAGWGWKAPEGPRWNSQGLCLTGLGSWPGNGETLASGRGGRGRQLPGKRELSKAHWTQMEGLDGGGVGTRDRLAFHSQGIPPHAHTHTVSSPCTETPLSDAHLDTHINTLLKLQPSALSPFFRLI